MPPSPIRRLRARCLSFPGAHEVEAWGEPTFRVRNKIFAMYSAPNNHHGGGRPAVWCKSTSLTQDLLVRAQPKRYFVPPYVGPSGWVGVWLDRNPDWEVLSDLLRDSYEAIAPKRPAKDPMPGKKRKTAHRKRT